MKILNIKYNPCFATELQRLCNLKAINYIMDFHLTSALLSVCWSALNAFRLPWSHFPLLVVVFREGQSGGVKWRIILCGTCDASHTSISRNLHRHIPKTEGRFLATQKQVEVKFSICLIKRCTVKTSKTWMLPRNRINLSHPFEKLLVLLHSMKCRQYSIFLNLGGLNCDPFT
jgi:hypothetical protein